jgi:phosphotransferase family enzyme
MRLAASCRAFSRNEDSLLFGADKKGQSTLSVNIANTPTGRAKLEDLQGMLLSATAHRVLRRQLRALLSAQAKMGPIAVQHAIFRPGRKLTAYYDARVRTDDAGAFRVRPIAVTWTLDGTPDPQPETSALAQLQQEAVHRGVAAPFEQLRAELPDSHLHLQVWPLDTQFPQLVRLSDPRHVHEMLGGRGMASKPARADGYGVTSIRYLPGNRHVLRYDRAGGQGGGVFAKLYSGEEGAGAFRVARQVAGWLNEQRGGVSSAGPLGYRVEDGVVLYAGVAGRPLSEYLGRPSRGLGEHLERAGMALRALHQLPQQAADSRGPHDFAAVISKIARHSEHIRMLLPPAGAAIKVLLDRAQGLHERLPQEPPSFTHRDFKSTHVWITPGGITLIDFDSSRLADPAQDIGNFLADMKLRCASCGQPVLRQMQERFLAGYARGKPEERLIRARLYEAVELLKMTRHLRLFHADWAFRTKQLIHRAEAVLNDLEFTLGLPSGRANRKQLVAISG